MESLDDKIKRFLSIGYGDCYGYGSGFGEGYGYGSGFGEGYGYGSGFGEGYGYGYGSGSGYGSGFGDGYGYGYGSGFGDGSGYGSGFGEGCGDLKSYDHRRVYYIDCVPTLIDSVRGTFAQGHIIQADKTLKACYIARHGNYFAHGDTLHKAQEDALAKYMLNMPEEERIAEFIRAHPDIDAEYPCEGLFKWHNTLTGSCEFGRRQFCKDNGIDLQKSYTVRFFLDITKNAYGGNVIKKVIEEYE